MNISFQMSDVEKRRATLAARCSNNLYGFYASLHTFLNFLIMWKQQKRNNINHKITSSTISKPSKKKDKRKSQRFWIPTGQTSSWWDNFCACQKVSDKWKENFCIPQKRFEKLRMKLRPYIQKNRGFRNPIYVEKQMATALYCLANEGRIQRVANYFGIEKSTISKIIRLVLFLL